VSACESSRALAIVRVAPNDTEPQLVAPSLGADPIATALRVALDRWIDDGDANRLRRELLVIAADL
jgi:hypothetical protein